MSELVLQDHGSGGHDQLLLGVFNHQDKVVPPCLDLVEVIWLRKVQFRIKRASGGISKDRITSELLLGHVSNHSEQLQTFQETWRGGERERKEREMSKGEKIRSSSEQHVKVTFIVVAQLEGPQHQGVCLKQGLNTCWVKKTGIKEKVSHNGEM